MTPHVLILHNAPTLPVDHPDAEAEHDIVHTAAEVRVALQAAGYRVSTLALGRDPQLLARTLGDRRVDVVFNLFEGDPDEGDTEAYVAGVLQWLRMPFTGAPMQALPLARDKVRTKLLLRGAGLPTPEFFVVDNVPAPTCSLAWPVIVKPALQDASVGMDHASVVRDQARFEARARHLLQTYGPPVLVEEYIAGREINVALWDTDGILHIQTGEIVFRDDGPGTWPIVTYASKWHRGSAEDERTPPRYPADLTPALRERIGDLATRAFRLLGCRDYARVDVRVRLPDEPFILEVNPNPALNADAGFASCLRASGIAHGDFIASLVRAALTRGGSGTLNSC